MEIFGPFRSYFKLYKKNITWKSYHLVYLQLLLRILYFFFNSLKKRKKMQASIFYALFNEGVYKHDINIFFVISKSSCNKEMTLNYIL